MPGFRSSHNRPRGDTPDCGKLAPAEADIAKGGAWSWPKRAARATFGWLPALFHWIGGHEAAVLIALLIVFLAITSFVALADEVASGETLRFDEWAIKAFRRADDPQRPIGPSWLLEVGRDITALGGVAVLTLLTLTVAGFLLLRGMYGAMGLVLAATLGGVVVTTILKSLFDRPRPNVAPHLAMVFTSSFPSGHSMLSATVYLTLGVLLGRFVTDRRLKAYFLSVALLLALLVGVSRVFLGVHYPTDVLAGWTAGLAWSLICWLVARYLQLRGAVERDPNGPVANR